MKKLISLSVLSLAMLVGVSVAEAKSTGAVETGNAVISSAAQIRTVVRTRTVRRGRALYRETYRTNYFRNGRVVTRLIRRVRIR